MDEQDTPETPETPAVNDDQASAGQPPAGPDPADHQPPQGQPENGTPADQPVADQPMADQLPSEQVSADPQPADPSSAEAEAPDQPPTPQTPASKPAIDLTGMDKRSLLEAFLFLEDKPVNLERLCEMLQASGREVRQLAEELKTAYQQRGGGLQINEIANGYILSTRADLATVLKQYYSQKNRPSFSKSAVEVLAIIAYKQPVTRIEIEEIRGAGIGNSLKILLERKLIRIAGRKDVVGHPLLYSTTREFLLYFGLKNLESLPTIREIREMEIQ
jgi:segregation and condensation protein B